LKKAQINQNNKVSNSPGPGEYNINFTKPTSKRAVSSSFNSKTRRGFYPSSYGPAPGTYYKPITYSISSNVQSAAFRYVYIKKLYLLFMDGHIISTNIFLYLFVDCEKTPMHI